MYTNYKEETAATDKRLMKEVYFCHIYSVTWFSESDVNNVIFFSVVNRLHLQDAQCQYFTSLRDLKWVDLSTRMWAYISGRFSHDISWHLQNFHSSFCSNIVWRRRSCFKVIAPIIPPISALERRRETERDYQTDTGRPPSSADL